MSEDGFTNHERRIRQLEDAVAGMQQQLGAALTKISEFGHPPLVTHIDYGAAIQEASAVDPIEGGEGSSEGHAETTKYPPPW